MGNARPVVAVLWCCPSFHLRLGLAAFLPSPLLHACVLCVPLCVYVRVTDDCDPTRTTPHHITPRQLNSRIEPACLPQKLDLLFRFSSASVCVCLRLSRLRLFASRLSPAWSQAPSRLKPLRTSDEVNDYEVRRLWCRRRSVPWDSLRRANSGLPECAAKSSKDKRRKPSNESQPARHDAAQRPKKKKDNTMQISGKRNQGLAVD